MRRMVSGITLTLLLIGILTMAFNIQPVKASGTIYIRADGSIDPPDAPVSTVDNVTYTLTDNITSSGKGIVIERDNIVVDGASYILQRTEFYFYSEGIDLTERSNVTIKNFEIKSFRDGISLSDSEDNSISGNNIRNNSCGIGLWFSSDNNVISGNNITANNYYGIYVSSSNNNNIVGNNITANNEYGIDLHYSSNNNSVSGNDIRNNNYGIYIYSSSNNTLGSNSMADNRYNLRVRGVTLPDFVNYVDFSNTVDSKPVYYWINEQDLTVPLDAGYVALVNCTRITVQNLNLTNNGQGILLARSNNISILQNNIKNNYNGVQFYSSSNNNITGNMFTNNGLVGCSPGNVIADNLVNGKPLVYLESSSGVKIENAGQVILINCDNIHVENLNLSHTDIGIHLQRTTNTKVTGNNITENNSYGIYISSSNNNNIVGNNITNNNEYGIYLSQSSNNSISGNNIRNNSYGIYLWISSDNNVISGNNITNNALYGIKYINSSNNNNIVGNNITENNYGLYLHYSSNNVISGNNIKNNSEGIRLGCHSNNNSISGNIVENNSYGIWLSGYWGPCNNNTISGNDITKNSHHGIVLDYFDYNIIFGNNIANNNGYGIDVSESSNNVISGNNITANNWGGVWLSSSSGNSIYHNNFVDNAGQVYIIGDLVNVWDDGFPSGGNYWSNYTGFDSDHDGIGDAPHVIGGNNTDHYPLMGKFSDFNATTGHHVQAICNSSISDFRYNGTALLFNVSGKNGTAGFCRMCIPKAFMNDTFRVFVNGTEILPFPEPLPCSNSTHNYIYFNYTHSEQEVVIIPEFPSYIVLPLFMTATLLAAMIHRRKRTH